MKFDVAVNVRLRPGIADPQGATIERAMPTLGFDAVEGVRVGKQILFGIEATDHDAAMEQVLDMCDRFLTNPVIEESSVELTPSGS